MSKIRVFTIDEALAVLHGPDPESIIDIEPKKNAKEYQGTIFVNVWWNIAGLKRQPGFFLIEDYVLTAGVANKNDKNDFRNTYEKTRMNFESNVANSPKYGEFLRLLDPIFNKKLLALDEQKLITIGKREITKLMQYSFSADSKLVELRGKEKDSPTIRIKFEWGKFPEKYPFVEMAGRPKTTIFDFDKVYLDEKKQPKYKVAQVFDEGLGKLVDVDDDNIHKFATKKSIIKKGRVLFSGVSISKMYVSMSAMITVAIMKTGGGEGFSDDIMCANPQDFGDLTQEVEGMSITDTQPDQGSSSDNKSTIEDDI